MRNHVPDISNREAKALAKAVSAGKSGDPGRAVLPQHPDRAAQAARGQVL